MIDKLTTREQEVLVELAKDPHTYAAIQKRLGVSHITISRHISNMYDKTGTENRVQLLLWAFREAQVVVRRFPPLEEA